MEISIQFKCLVFPKTFEAAWMEPLAPFSPACNNGLYYIALRF